MATVMCETINARMKIVFLWNKAFKRLSGKCVVMKYFNHSLIFSRCWYGDNFT